MVENHYGYAAVPKEYKGHGFSKLGAPAKTIVAGTNGLPGGANSFMPEIKGGNEEMFYNPIPQQKPNGLTVLELFAGGGLMAAGLKSAGYDIVWANDFDKSACEAYRYNYGEHIVHGDITAIDPRTMPGVDIIAGGPPCQDFSVAGTGAGEEGDRGKLVWAYLSIIEAKQPKAFIFENVKGLVGKKHKHTFDALLGQFEQIGYRVNWTVVNSWDYGVAQKRERVFIIGIRNDLGFSYQFPEPDAELYRTQVLRDVIGDLPEPGEKKNHAPEKQLPPGYQRVIDGVTRSNYGNGIKVNDGSEPAATILARYWEKGPPSEVYQPDNHERKDISEKALEGYDRRGGTGGFGFRVNDWDDPSPTIFGRIFNEGKAFVHPGPDNHDRPLSLHDIQEAFPERGPSYSGTLDRAVEQGAEITIRVSMPDNHDGSLFDNVGNNPTWEHADREDLEAPAPTRTEKDRCDGINTINGRPRRFTVRECLRIQSVPDWYVLPDSISLSAQYRIVGNGVASRVAYLLGAALAEQLKAAEMITEDEWEAMLA